MVKSIEDEINEIKDRKSSDSNYEKEFFVGVEDLDMCVTYRFRYKLTDQGIELFGKWSGTSSHYSFESDDDADYYDAEKGTEALEIAIKYLQKKYPDIKNIDIKPKILYTGAYAAWNTDQMNII